MTGLIAFELPAYSFGEGELFATITAERAGDLANAATVTWSTAPGPTGSRDFPIASGTAIFPPGTGQTTIAIPITDDATVEPDQQFRVILTKADAASALGETSETAVTIKDDDAQRANPAPDALIPPYRASTEAIGSGFDAPVTMVFIPGTSLAFVAEKAGIIKLLDTSAGTSPARLLLDISERVNSYRDRGLLGLALHPDLARYPYLYAFYTVDPAVSWVRNGNAGRDGPGNRFSYLSRFTLDLSGQPKIVPGSEVILLGKGATTFADISGNGDVDSTDQRNAGLRPTNVAPGGGYRRDVIKDDTITHVGGALAFGADGKLYVSVGDGSSYEYADPRAGGAVIPDSLNGKILRIDPLTGAGLPDNPYADADLGDNRSKVWSMGLRNPFTITFAPDGRLFVADTGWNTWEEINVVQKGGNYGWPYFEGGDGGEQLMTAEYQDFPDATAFYWDVATGDAVVTPPWRAFAHDDTSPGFQVTAIVGAAAIYDSGPYPAALNGSYFFTDIVDGEIYAANIADRSVRFITDLGAFGPTAFNIGPDGYLYLVDMAANRILRLTLTDNLNP